MTRFLSLTDTAVREAARATAAATGTTTTLDVKRRLRAEGYWATQADVSHRVARVAACHGWLWWGMGPFRLYGVPHVGESGMAATVRTIRAN